MNHFVYPANLNPLADQSLQIAKKIETGQQSYFCHPGWLSNAGLLCEGEKA
jgi:hypothetical protein